MNTILCSELTAAWPGRGKAAVNARAVQTLSRTFNATMSAKCLDCGDFSTAFAGAPTNPQTSIGPGHKFSPQTVSRRARTVWPHRFGQWIAIGCLSVVCAATDSLNAQTNEAGTFQPVLTIDGTPRLEDVDVVYLTKGETLRGKIVNDSVTVHTAYGSLRLEVDWLAGIAIDRQSGHLDRVKTVNRNQFSGFINEDFEFRKESGEIVRLNTYAVERIIFQQRPNESSHGATQRFLVLESGDLLSGQVLDWNPTPGPGGASVAAGLDDIELVRLAKGTRDLKILLRTGEETTASLKDDALRVELDLGPSVVLPVPQLRALYARTGSPPLPVRREFDGAVPSEGNASAEPPAATPDGMVWIQPGRFQMGSYPSELGHGPDEDPPTEVVITHGFWMGAYEVTQAEYLEFMGVNPSGYQGQPDLPVEKVTWNEAAAYCEKRTVHEREAGRLPPGFVYRLPTEAEWEYTCRAGSTTRFHFGDDLTDVELPSYAWFISNSDSSTHSVGKLKPNAWGLHDMHGNVWEWCQDLWQDAYPGGTATNYAGPSEGWLRVARGGSWLYDGSFCRSANRDSYGPENRCSDIGFRVVLAPPL